MIDEYELQFLLMLNSKLSIADITEKVIASTTGTQRTSSSSFLYSNNWIQISKNGNHSEAYKPLEDSYLYFKYRVEVSPIEETTLIKQIELAKKLRKTLSTISDEVEIAADFEKLLR
jgi:hypothetical protein